MPNLPAAYFDAAIELLRRLRDEEVSPIEEVGAVVGEALRSGGRLFAFGCSHSSLPVQDIVYRAGGLMLVNPVYGPGIAALDTRPTTLGSDIEKLPGYAKALLDNSPLREGDVLIVVSVSGRNAVPIEIAQLAAERGATVIAVTSHEYTDAVESRHPSGKKMKDFAHHVLDNKVQAGDAVLSLPGVPQRFCALSGVTSTALLHALVAAVIADLDSHGETPPVFLAANVDGGAEWNAEHMSRNADRIFYL
ncbi:sugar isomerase domain-containing protein [Streptomyces sp. AJS327]|uniref:sugar isomerase domain-containing protein n=1 Tax=Streptomyces sp. AJS327 TaxID=2545265 RepID=UPI0015DF3A79|nr:SIS domain-containing protein [Streptomyces sp. AJS327]MBA0051282.1 sugar isomerase domain-containing protein [Streptomyces sp. AJS327]